MNDCVFLYFLTLSVAFTHLLPTNTIALRLLCEAITVRNFSKVLSFTVHSSLL